MNQRIIFGGSGKLGSEISKVSSHTISPHSPSLTPSYLQKIVPQSGSVCIDVSSHYATKEHCDFCRHHNIPLVIGTTGHTQLELETIAETSKYIPLLHAANFSLVSSSISQFLLTLPSPISALIEESHPTTKKDTPSGTALEYAKNIKSHSYIKSIKNDDAPFTHKISVFFKNESISLTYTVNSRASYVKGALLASDFLSRKNAGYYTMKDLLNEMNDEQ